MKKLVAATTALAILACCLRAQADQISQVTLRIDGVHDDNDGIAIMDALRQLPNIKVANRPTAKDPSTALVPLDGASYDIGDLARAVAAAKTPNRAKGPPSAWLVLSYKGHEERGMEEALARSLELSCSKLKGVDAKKCRLDTKRKEVRLKLDDVGGAKLADITAAFPGLDVE
jgi:hypothetical protein